VHMYTNEKMKPTRTFPEMREGKEKGKWWRG
jgi:hypothetical protein